MPEDKALRCDCGYEITATDEADVVEEIRAHARCAHGIDFSVQEARLVVRRSTLDLSTGRPSTDTPSARVAASEGGEQ